MTDFKVTESGWYRTRAGELAEVVVSGLPQMFPVIGYVKEVSTMTWEKDGRILPNGDGESVHDLVEYLGKERPKQPKKFKVKARLYNNGEIVVDDDNACFVNVLRIVETREIEWEVPDNG